ncbi:LuxR C-terminal-related transcriptional regulator (plasmid) [Mesorhizobium sp. AR02]|nr:LuxR C-terminal-related transcriptional regulator [Mesorhizobium sp. AR02]
MANIAPPGARAHRYRMNAVFPRTAIVHQILGRPEAIVVLEAPAGMGKSVILNQIARQKKLRVHADANPPKLQTNGLALWDIPPHAIAGPLPEQLLSGGSGAIIAKRPDTEIPGLPRALAYGAAHVLDREMLLVSAEEGERFFGPKQARRIMAVSGGWPLIAFRGDSFGNLSQFLRFEFLADMVDEELVDLKLLAEGAALPPRSSDGLFPIARVGQNRRLQLCAQGLSSHLSSAVEAVISERLSTPAGANAIAETYAEHARPVDAITTYQQVGFYDKALAEFNRAGGLFFIYFHGTAANDRVLAGFPASYAHQSEILVLSLALQSLKRGDISRARRLIADRFGDSANDVETVFASRTLFSREFREFRFLMLIYEDHQFSEELLATLFNLIAEFPGDAHLFRGTFYNSMLEYYIRRREFAKAEQMAQRAMHHYQSAHAPILSFYISLHQAMMALMKGDTIAARKHAMLSAKSLSEVPFETPNDMRLQALLEACVEYDGGRAESLARFLNTEIDDFSHSEIWPSLMEFTLLYGSQAMATHFSLLAARGFLDRWRVYQISNHAFQAMVSIREAIILQNANRWSEAATRLRSIGTSIDSDWVLAHPGDVSRLVDRDDISLLLAWMRQILHEQPDLPQIETLLAATLSNLSITDRQRMGVNVWLAHVHRRRRDLTKARAILLRVFEDAARLGSIAPLAEEKLFLGELLDNKRISEFLGASSSARQVIRKLRDSGHLSPVPGIRSELSRRENKILVIVSEGAANKSIAVMLGVSEATVKFHLGNVYRKLGCRTRQEAISIARATGIVG